MSQRGATGRTQEAVVSDLGEALGQDMLEEASDELMGWKRAALPLVASAILEAEGDVPIFELLNAIVRDSNTPDVGSEIGDHLCTCASRLTMGHPGLLPDMIWHLFEQVGFGKLLHKLATEDFRQRSYRNKPILIAR